ncbi:uL15 family ribosomal protein [Candidatus Micrarchaeota archaeon]|nr:uL15 family ribosomal protein [Candidatus Micrarchaeota archaeon]
MRRHKRKITKQRGSRHVGRGKAKRGRGKGSHMGRGSVKRSQRNKMHIYKYEPERLNHKGFFSIYAKSKQRAINLDDIERLTEKNEINVVDFKFGKVLGGGTITRPLKITAYSFSAKAKEKIQKAGGQAIVLGEKVEP